MRKIIAIILISFFMPVSCYGAFFKNDGKTPNVETSKGYVGTLPDLTKEHEPSEPAVSTPIFDKTQDFHSENAIKPIPRDNPTFVNIILKTDKKSPYLNDIQEIIDILEQIYDSIETEENVQRFASRVYYLNMSADYLKDKYEGKPESGYTSFKQIQTVSTQAQEVSTLRSDAEKYKRYLAYSDSGAQYSKNNIDVKMFNLKLSVEKTINILKNTK